jgi:hypothetical protein
MIPLVQNQDIIGLACHICTRCCIYAAIFVDAFSVNHIISPRHAKYCETLTGKFDNMPKINARTDVHVIESVKFLQRCPKATVQEAMIVGNVSMCA